MDDTLIKTLSLALGIGLLIGFQRQRTGSEPLHEAAQWLSEADVRAIMRLVILSLVILPLLPDATFGPYDVLILAWPL